MLDIETIYPSAKLNQRIGRVGLYPANTVPNWADLLLGFFMPRVLILIYIFQNMGYDNIWFVAHLIAAVLAYTGGSRETVRRRRRRRET